MRGTEFAEMAAFAAIADHRSFAKAAAQLGLARSTLSQNLRALEERLGVRLLNRTTRSVSPTEAGERLLRRLRPLLEQFAAAADDTREIADQTAGLLRLVVQPPVASLLMGPLLGRFMARHPGVRVDISVVKMPADIVKDGYDAGIRIGEQIERNMIVRRVIGDVRFVVVASPEYLERHGAPKHPRDLPRHDCIRNRLPNGTVFGWQFQKGGRAIQSAVNGRLIVDDIELSIRAALDGMGLAYLLYDYVRPHITERTLVPMLEDWSPQLSGFFLYYPSRRHMAPPLQAFIDFLATETGRRVLSGSPPLSKVYPNYRLVGAARPRQSR